MALDYGLLNLIVTIAAFFLTFVFRKRILTAFGRLLFKHSVEFVRATYFDEVDEDTEDGQKLHHVRLNAKGTQFLTGVMPSIIQTALKSIKLKPGGMLPINPATGQLDFMAPVLGKLASGKKVGFEDFLPLIMDKAMPLVESLMGGFKKGASKREEKPEEVPSGAGRLG